MPTKHYDLATDLTDNSDLYIPSQKAVKDAIDNISVSSNLTLTNYIPSEPLSITIKFKDPDDTSSTTTVSILTGSSQIVPNGFDEDNNPVFLTLTTNVDQNVLSIYDSLNTQKRTLLMSTKGYISAPLGNMYSGDTAPENVNNYPYWYDTLHNTIRVYANNQWSAETGGTYSFPWLCYDYQQFTAFDKAGYIGSTFFVRANAKFNVCNFRDTSNKLLTKEVTIPNILLLTLDSSLNLDNAYLLYNPDTNTLEYTNNILEEITGYLPSKNTNISSSLSLTVLANFVIIGTFSCKNGKIIDFDKYDETSVTDQNTVFSLRKATINKFKEIPYENLTNCIKQLSTNVKLDLENNIVTLYENSIVYDINDDPITNNSTSTVYFTESINITDANNEKVCLFYSNYNLAYVLESQIYYQDTQPVIENEQKALWYNTSTKQIMYANNGPYSFTESGISYPFAILQSTNNTITEILQYYDVITCFAEKLLIIPDTILLAANGINQSTKKLQKSEIITQAIIYYISDLTDNTYYVLYDNTHNVYTSTQYLIQTNTPTITNAFWYNPSTNIMYRYDSTTSSYIQCIGTIICKITISNNKISNIFDINYPNLINTFNCFNEISNIKSQIGAIETILDTISGEIV